jgi:tetratricopeptide (TPR) repeat protein
MAVLDGLSEGAQGDNEWIWWELGRSARSAEDWEVALRAYERGAQQSDDPCPFWEAQADVLEELEEWAAAEALSLQALAACSQHLWPYMRLGDLRRRADDLEAALHWFGQAEQLWPQNAAPKHYLGTVYLEQGQLDQARAYLQQALQLEPDNEWSTNLLAWCYHESGDGQAAVDTLARAIALSDEQPWTWAVRLGEWHVELGNGEEALAAYQQALSWQPGDERILERIDLLTGSDP